MKKILLTGVSADVTEERVRSKLDSLGRVHAVEIIREGDETHPMVLVTIDISDELAFQIVSRVSHYWHDGNLITASLLPDRS